MSETQILAAVSRQFDQLSVLDVKSEQITLYYLTAGKVTKKVQGSYEETVIYFARLLPKSERPQFLRQLDLPRILKTLEVDPEVIVGFHTADEQYYKLTFRYIDDSRDTLLITRQNETSYARNLHLVEDSLRRDSERFHFLLGDICEYFIEIEVKTGRSNVINSRESFPERELFQEQVPWLAEKLIVPEQRNTFLREFELDQLVTSLQRGNGRYITQFDGIYSGGNRRLRIVSALFTRPYIPDSSYILSYARDISELRKQEEKNKQLIDISQQLLNLSQTDPLTGLYNRTAGEKIIGAHLAQESSSCYGTLLLLDIDFFKNCNDAYGHQTGDHVLQYFSRAIRDIFRSDDVLCRWGGDEFLIFMRNVGNLKGVEARIARLQVKMQECITEDAVAVPVTVSVGGVVANRPTSLCALFEIADRKLYEMKESGRNGSRIQPAL